MKKLLEENETQTPLAHPGFWRIWREYNVLQGGVFMLLLHKHQFMFNNATSHSGNYTSVSDSYVESQLTNAKI